jgi:putative MATE family efflux protein
MNDLTQGSIGRHLAQMSIFIATGMIVQTLYYLVDLYFVAHLGEHAIAGVSAGGNVMYIIMALTNVLGVSTTALIGHAAGRKDQAAATTVFNQSLLLSMLCGVLTLAGGYWAAGAYVGSISSDAETTRDGVQYLYWFIPGLGLQFALVTIASALRGTGIARPTMIVQIVTVFLNIVLAPVLIAGWGTGRPLGVLGAGLASTIAVTVGVVWLIVYFARLEHFVAVDKSLWRPNFKVWKQMFNIGLPSGGEFALLFIVNAVVYWCVQRFGTEAQAGYGVGARVMQSIFLPAMAVAFAASPIAAQNFGAKRSDRVRETFRVAALSSSIIMIVLTGLCQWIPELLVKPFASDANVIAVAAQYLRIVSWNFVGIGLVFTCSGLFQAIGNTWPSLANAGLRVFLFVAPALWLTQQLWIKIEHFWYLSIASIVVQAIFAVLLLQQQFRRRLPAMHSTVAEAA